MTADRPDSERPPTEAEWQRKKRLAALFGEVLPEATSDDLPEVTTEVSESSSDEWLRAQVPPHHG